MHGRCMVPLWKVHVQDSLRQAIVVWVGNYDEREVQYAGGTHSRYKLTLAHTYCKHTN